MNNSLVSMILPVYNGQQYISQAISSVLQQSYKNIELIITDDGSTDNSKNIITSFHDNRIKYHFQANAGPSAARNIGIKLSKGDYIAFIDADDVYESDKIEKQVSFITTTDADAVYCDIRLIDKNSKTIGIVKSEGIFTKREDFLAMLLFRQIIPGPQNLLIKQCCFKNGLKYDECYVHSEDYKFTLDLAMKYRIAYQPKVLYNYRRHSTNLSNQHSKQRSNEIAIIKELGIEKIKKIVADTTFSQEKKNILLAKILYKIGCYKMASKVLSSLPQQTEESLFYAGNISFFQNKIINATKIYQKSMSINRQKAELHNNLGCCYVSLGRIKDAERCFINALNISSNYRDAASNLTHLNDKTYDHRLTFIELRTSLMPYR